MSEKLVSFLIPSRNRFDSLLKAIGSIIKNTNDLSRVEVVLRFDEDDGYSLARVDELPTNDIDINITIGKRFGYVELHRYVNEMCRKTKGEFIAWFNDDCIVETKDWDNIIAKYSGKLVSFYPNNKKTGSGNIFPIIHRKVFEILGHFSMAPQVDTWQFVVCNRAGIEIKRDDLVFIHNRKQDYISDDCRDAVLNKNSKTWSKTKQMRNKDTKKIKEYIKKHGNTIK